MTAKELIAILRRATEEDVINARRHATGHDAAGAANKEPSDLLRFFNMMLDELIDEAVRTEVEGSIHATALAHIRNLRDDQFQQRSPGNS